MEQEFRKQAIKRYPDNEKPKSIYTDLNRSNYWFFKWLERYQSNEADYTRINPRAPCRRPTALREIDKQRIVSVRQRLES